MKFLKTIEQFEEERARWIDDTIKKNVPKWKLDLLKKVNHSVLRKLIRVDVEITHEELIAQYGIQVIITLNGKVIGKRKYSLSI